MSRTFFFIPFVCMCVFILTACTSSTEFTPVSPDYENIIQNSWFYPLSYPDSGRLGGRFDGWTITDSSLIVENPATLDTIGDFSQTGEIGIRPGVSPKIGAISTIAVPPSPERFPFRLEIEAVSGGDTGNYYVDIYKPSGVRRLYAGSITDTNWQDYDFRDSGYAALDADSIRVTISAGSVPVPTQGMIVVYSCRLLWPTVPAGYSY